MDKHQAESKLSYTLPSEIVTLKNIFQNAGHQLYIVGGAIRDTLLGKTPKDFDLCTDAVPDRILTLLKQNNIKTELRGAAHAVVMAQFPNSEYLEFEIATFRIDEQTDGRHATVKTGGVTIEEDVQRRDFTCNALFMDLHTNSIIDLVGGIADIENKVVRCVGEPETRFIEDQLRKLRAIRFATRLGFIIHPETFNAIVKNPTLDKLSKERICDELFTIFKTADLLSLITMLYNTKLIFEIFPNINVVPIKDIKLSRIVSFTTFIASLIKYDNSLEDKLADLSFNSGIKKTVESVSFLLGFDVKTVNPIAFHTKRKSTSLTNEELIAFFSDTPEQIKWLAEFKPRFSVTDMYMNIQGFAKEALGAKLAEHYADEYKILFKEIA